MEKIRYGIISTAQIVPRFVEGIRESAKGEVRAVASRSEERAKEMAQALKIPVAYGSYEELCQDPEVDIVYIATYNKGHFEAAKLALNYGKHVLLEKPFTLKYEEANALFSLAKRNQCFLMEAQKSVFLPIALKVKEVIQQRKIGAVRWIESITSYPNVDHIPWFGSLEAGGGALHGSGSYPLQYMQFLLDQSITYCDGAATRKKGSTDEQCTLSIGFENEVLGTIFISVVVNIPSKLTIYGEKGRIEIPYFWKTKTATVYYENGSVEILEGDFTSEFVFEVEHVNTCLEQHVLESPVMTSKITVDTVQFVDKVYQKWLEKEQD